jgi:hypothetical protein
MEITYAFIENFPVMFTNSEAWGFLEGKWEKFHPAEAYHDAKVLTHRQFRNSFPDLPRLPANAFKNLS